MMMERQRLAFDIGSTFGGKRRIDKVLGYAPKLSYADYRDRYDRGGIAKRVVDTYPKATWRGGWQLVEDDSPTTVTAFEQAWLTLADRIKVGPMLRRADILAGIGQYAVVFIGVAGGSRMDTEMPRLSGPESVLYLSAYPEGDAKVDSFEENPADPRYTQPKFYSLHRTSQKVAGGRSQQQRVHWSRVLHIADGLLDDEVYAPPRLQAVWNYLDDIVKVVGGGAEAFWLRANQGTVYSIGDPEDAGTTPPSPEEIAQLQERAEEMAHQMRRTLAARNIEVKTLGSDVANFATPLDALLSLVSATAEIPKRILLGSEMGQLASAQDRHNFESRVMDRRLDFAGPLVVRPFVDLLVAHNGLPTPERYDIWWPEILNLSELERADVLYKYAQANRAEPDGPILTVDELRDRVMGLPPMDPAVVHGMAREAGVQPAAMRDLLRSKQVLRALNGKDQPTGKTFTVGAAKKNSRKATRMSIVSLTGARGGSGA